VGREEAEGGLNAVKPTDSRNIALRLLVHSTRNLLGNNDFRISSFRDLDQLLRMKFF
jgi:hypothetical protein